MRYTVKYNKWLKQWYVCDNQEQVDYLKPMYWSNVKEICEDFIINTLQQKEVGYQYSLF